MLLRTEGFWSRVGHGCALNAWEAEGPLPFWCLCGWEHSKAQTGTQTSELGWRAGMIPRAGYKELCFGDEGSFFFWGGACLGYRIRAHLCTEWSPGLAVGIHTQHRAMKALLLCSCCIFLVLMRYLQFFKRFLVELSTIQISLVCPSEFVVEPCSKWVIILKYLSTACLISSQ